jgi:uracil-DNA glycosylase
MNRTPATATPQATLRKLVEEVRAYIEYQQSTGVEAFPQAAPDADRTVGQAVPATPHGGPNWRTQEPAGTACPTPSKNISVHPELVEGSVSTRVTAASGNLFVPAGVQRAQTLEELRAEIGDCRRCKLCAGRTHLVFGVGDPHARLMFVGEGPGRDEDLRGEPFVGRAGQLLTEIITKGMKLRREDVYIANVIKCRPPENRNPEPDEIAACQPFLLRQVEIVQPKVLVALGTFAAQTLLGLRVPISRLRGHWHNYHGIKLMPTLHPAYLLRNPSDKKLVWADIKMVLSELENYA